MPEPMFRNRLCLTLTALLPACALSAPPAAATLTAGAEGPTHELDVQAHAALLGSEAAPADAEAALAAARLLFQAADRRLQSAVLAVLDAESAPDLARVLTADDRLPDPQRTAILSLCQAGLAAADRAAAARPDAAGAPLYRGLHLSLVAWANGPARSLFAGYGPRLVAAIDAAIAADAEQEQGAPLRLAGRFRSKAPWPYGDLPAAITELRRAVALAPVVVNQLFLGDAMHAAGDEDAARDAWTAAAAAAGTPSTRWSDDLLRELARRRLQALPPRSRG